MVLGTAVKYKKMDLPCEAVNVSHPVTYTILTMSQIACVFFMTSTIT